MDAVIPVDFSKSGAYLIKASVSGPATASTRTTLADEPVLVVVVPFEQAVASKATTGNSDNSRTPILDLIRITSSQRLVTESNPPAPPSRLRDQPMAPPCVKGASGARLASPAPTRPPSARNRSTTSVAAPIATASGPRRPSSIE